MKHSSHDNDKIQPHDTEKINWALTVSQRVVFIHI